MMYIVSGCLVGINCKYNGENNYNEEVVTFLKDKEFIIACPEQLGGLCTPRPKSEISGDLVITEFDGDVTKQFEKGANEALKIAKMFNCTHAILKEKSPSCGVSIIYDGTFSGVEIKGMGKAAEMLKNNGILIMSEKDLG